MLSNALLQNHEVESHESSGKKSAIPLNTLKIVPLCLAIVRLGASGKDHSKFDVIKNGSDFVDTIFSVIYTISCIKPILSIFRGSYESRDLYLSSFHHHRIKEIHPSIVDHL